MQITMTRDQATQHMADLQTIGQYVAKTFTADSAEWQAMERLWNGLSIQQERGEIKKPEERLALQEDDVLRIVGKAEAGKVSRRELRQRIQGLAAFKYAEETDKGKLLGATLERLAAKGRISAVNEVVTIVTM